MKLYLWSIILAVLFVEIYSVLPARHTELNPGEGHPPNHLTGAIHVTSEPAFAKDHPSLLEAASSANLDFMVIADLGITSPAQSLARSHGKLDVFVELESPTAAGHLLFFYSHTKAKTLPDAQLNELAWQHFSGSSKDQYPEAFTVTAHPTHPKVPWNALDRFPEGTEIFSIDGWWRNSLDFDLASTTFSLFTYPLNNYLSLLRAIDLPRKQLASWDAMNAASQGRFGVAAVSAHESFRTSASFPITWRNAPQALRTVQNILFVEGSLPDDYEERKRAIYSRIRAGNLAIHFPFVFPFSNSDWRLKCGEKIYRSGARAAASSDCEFQVQSPNYFPHERIVRLWKDGELVREIVPAPARITLPLQGRGNYRLEVWARPHSLFRLAVNREVPYLIYNPIYVN